MLTLRHFSAVYPDGTRAIDSIDLALEQGESVALIGANGAGKSSLLMALVGVVPSEGEATVAGVRLERQSLARIRALAGVVFQNPDDQLFMPSIGDDVAFGLRSQGIAEEEVGKRVADCLARLHIEHLRDRTPLKLSGGEKRMAALATVLVMEPSVMLFDEPTAFLDPRARRSLAEALRGLPETKLIATHDLAFAMEVCPRALLIKDGRLFADGATKALLSDAQLMEACGL